MLVISFLFLNGGYYLWFSILQFEIQSEVSAEIEKGVQDKDLTAIEVETAHPEGIQWIKPGKEFRYKGDMYDVVRSSVQGKKTVYHCIRDKKEKQLISHFYRHQKAKKDLEKKLKRIFQYKFVFAKNTPDQDMLTSEVVYSPYGNQYCSPSFDIHSPPPRIG